MNDEQPYLIRTAHGPLVSIPYTQEVNDISMFLRRNLMATDAFQLMKDEFDELYRSGETSGRIMSIGLHPHIIGRAFRARAIREFLEYAKSFDGVWWATREEIADWYLQNHRPTSAETGSLTAQWTGANSSSTKYFRGTIFGSTANSVVASSRG